ncbi:hypothetical protein SERLA73DRAFT_44354, partial [Serpula lacrymans var. lacrymans S7.3]
RLGLSYHNIKGLHKIVDSGILSRADWTSKTIAFPDAPDDKHLIHYRDILSAICSLLGNPAHAKHIVYKPKKIFSNAQKENRIYNKMWTGKRWHAIQVIRLPKGAALSPVVIATDKTQLTQFSDSKSAYPVYLTLGNIPRAIQRRPSQHACILIGYLSVSKIIGIEKSSRVQRLFHESMKIILDPLTKAGRDGIEVVGGDGAVRRVYSVLACYVADYPEQCLVMCSKYGTYPKYKQPPEELSASTAGEPRTDQWTESVINKAKEDTQL